MSMSGTWGQFRRRTGCVATENDTEGAAAHNFDVAAVGHGDVTIVGVGNVVLEEFLNRTYITGSPAVDTRMCHRGLERV